MKALLLRPCAWVLLTLFATLHAGCSPARQEAGRELSASATQDAQQAPSTATLSAAQPDAAMTHDAECPPATAARQLAYGTVMADVARRFELLGRAASAGRFELADYELGELRELFEDALPHAAPPREGHPEILPKFASGFLQFNLTDLGRVLTARDRVQATAAFARTATACNLCHKASGHGFIEVPLVAGQSIPNTDPVTP